MYIDPVRYEGRPGNVPERLEKEQVGVVHVGVCCQNRQGQLCPAISELTEALRQRGMTVVRGTHG